MAGENENEPLINVQEDSSERGTPPPPSLPAAQLPSIPTEGFPPPMGGPPPIMPGEQPPPYSAMPAGGMPMINCRVCQSMINLEGKLHQHVVKCSVCQEATPIKEAPVGKKYVRCPCNCLLICKATSRRIACPRQNCKRIITLNSPANLPLGTTVVSTFSGCRAVCGHCNETFTCPRSSCLVRCPYCRKVSSVGAAYARNRSLIYAIVGFLFLVAGVAVTVGTVVADASTGGIYFIWIGAYVVGLLNLIRAMYYATMKVSHLEGSQE
ncbi:Type 1 phosphatidylinositol 4,5-bisphosphate 4-phosphatase [Holothuria leucospilota]|uniref:Phosphatidylinositol-4,5-bisphosphate 4-phosphatase n=1 Tax=Holothuria leucospilota TaxID=206669 RepID=A0A9Q1C9V9_HOLLE|nr:Type 1 phosphatidylinositol 4,5-bisphosphate 4-phosphatase [Holothuria leucospilota]